MRHLRTSVNQLPEADPNLGYKFAAINRELNELTKSVPPSHKLSMDNGAADDLRTVDPFGRLVLKQRRLLKERDKLIPQNQIFARLRQLSDISTLRHTPFCCLVGSPSLS